jgi:hypothetical protein
VFPLPSSSRFAAPDVAAAVTAAAVSDPVNGVIEIAGPAAIGFQPHPRRRQRRPRRTQSGRRSARPLLWHRAHRRLAHAATRRTPGPNHLRRVARRRPPIGRRSPGSRLVPPDRPAGGHRVSPGHDRTSLPSTPVNRPEAPLKPLDASRALPPSQGRSLRPLPIRPAPPCSASVQETPYSQ